MKTTLCAILVVLVGLVGWRSYHRHAVLESARAAVDANSFAVRNVAFDYLLTSCPPRNEAAYSAWLSRRIDAEVAVKKAQDVLGRDHDDVLDLNFALTNQNFFFISDQKLKCLRRQLELLDAELLDASRERR